MSSDTETAEVGAFCRNTFRGVAHRVLPGIGFIKPDDAAEVEKFFKINGGKWKKPEKREVFFHESHVVGAAVRKGDKVEFVLSADPNGKFGERTVQAREILGGSGSKLEVKVEELEKGMLSDRKEVAHLKQEMRSMGAKIQLFEQQAGKIAALEEDQRVLGDHIVEVVKRQGQIEVIEAKIQQFEDTMGETVKNGLLEALSTIKRSHCEDEVDEAARVRLPNTEVAGSAMGDEAKAEPGEVVDGSSGDDLGATVETEAKNVRSSGAKPKKARKAYDFSPSTFQSIKTGMGLSLFLLVLFFGQLAMFNGEAFQFEAKVVARRENQSDSQSEEVGSVEVIEHYGCIDVANGLGPVGGVDKASSIIVFYNRGRENVLLKSLYCYEGLALASKRFDVIPDVR
jgi:hypothetical protein